MRQINYILLAACIFHLTSCDTKQQKESTSMVYVAQDAGKNWNVFGLTIVGKIFSDQTQGKYAVIKSETPPNGGPPKHLHQKEDELFYVLKGTYKFYCGDSVIVAKPGALVHLPKGIPHGFTNIGDSTGVLINTITPGGFEYFFEDVQKLESSNKFTRVKVDSLAALYGLKFIK